MKRLLAILLAATSFSFITLPAAIAQTALTVGEQAIFDALPAAARTALLARLGTLSATQRQVLMSLPPADIEKLAALPDGDFTNVVQLPPAALAVVAALPANQLSAVGTLPVNQLTVVAALPVAQRGPIFQAVTSVKTEAVAGNAANVASAVGALNAALGVLPDSARADFTVAVAVNLEASVAGTAGASPVRSVVAATIGGLTQIAVSAGASPAQVATLTAAATTAQAEAAEVTIGAVTPDAQGSGTNPG